jgi:hypothetical protein
MDERRRRSESEPAGWMMPNGPGPRPGPARPTVYQIRVRGHLEDRWADWHEGLTVTLEETGDTLLTVPVVDQAALHGLLRRLRDLGVPLLSINPAASGQPGNSSKEETSR